MSKETLSLEKQVVTRIASRNAGKRRVLSLIRSLPLHASRGDLNINRQLACGVGYFTDAVDAYCNSHARVPKSRLKATLTQIVVHNAGAAYGII